MTTLPLLAMALAIVFAGQAAPGDQDYFPPPESQGGWRTLVSANTAPSPEQRAALRERVGPNRTFNEHPEFYLELFSRIMAAFDGPKANAKDAGPYGSGK